MVFVIDGTAVRFMNGSTILNTFILPTVIFDVKVKLLHENTPNTDHKHMTYFMLHLTEVRLFTV